jgi:hypothetical protein
MVPVLVTLPSGQLVEVADLRLHMRVDHGEDDTVIASLFAAAVGYLDGYGGILGRAIQPQTWAQQWNCAGPYLLALPDVDTGALVVTADGAAVASGDVTTELTAAGLVVTVAGSPALPVRIEYECAMPADKLAVAKVAAMLLAAHWYANREAVGQPMEELPMTVAALIAPLRRVKI